MLKVVYEKHEYKEEYSVRLEVDYSNYDRSYVGKDITIASTYMGLPVTAFESSYNVEVGCVTLPNSLKSLESGCFSGSKIKTLHIPKDVEKINFLAFSSNTIIENLSISPLNKHFKMINGSIYTYDGKELIAYFSKNNQKEFVVPSHVEVIASGAFYGAPSLEKVSFAGNNLKKVCSYAFANCAKLECVKFPKGLEYVGNYTFDTCKKLKEVYFPNTLKFIDKHCFSKSPNAIIYCEFKESGKNWPKTWKNKDENVIYGIDMTNENFDENVIKHETNTFKEKIDKSYNEGNSKKSCLKKYDLWATNLSNINNTQLLKDLKNLISYLIIYFEKNYQDDVSTSILDEILARNNNIDMKELDDIKKEYDSIEDFTINDVKSFISYLSKLDFILYDLTVDLILKLSLSKGCLSKNLFNCICIILGSTTKYLNTWSKVDINSDNFISSIKEELVDTGVKVTFKKISDVNYDVVFNHIRCEQTFNLVKPDVKVDEIDISTKLLLKVLNFDFKGAADIFEDGDLLNKIKELDDNTKDAIFSIVFRICLMSLFPIITDKKFRFYTNVDDFIRLYDHFEKNGFNINLRRAPVYDINLFTFVTMTFAYTESRKDYQWIKKLFRHMLHNSSIDKTTRQLFFGGPAEILTNIVNENTCPDKYSLLKELKEVLKKENLYEDDDDDDFVEEEEYEDDDDIEYIKASSPFGTFLINPKTGSTKSVTGKVVDVSYKNNSFGLIIAELDSFVKNKSKSFEVTVKYKFKGTPKGTTFDISQAEYSFDNCRYIGTSWQHTFTIMFRGQATLFGYTGDIMMELALKLDEDYFFEIEDIVLNKADYKYDGNHLTVVYKFDIITD